VQRLEFECPDVCWHANFRRSETGWAWFSIHTHKVAVSHDEARQRYLANPYRGLLTRRMMLSSNPLGEEAHARKPPHRRLSHRLRSYCGITPRTFSNQVAIGRCLRLSARSDRINKSSRDGSTPTPTCPRRARWFRESGCGSLEQRSGKRRPSILWRVFC
jgi:hypothetical protein